MSNAPLAARGWPALCGRDDGSGAAASLLTPDPFVDAEGQDVSSDEEDEVVEVPRAASIKLGNCITQGGRGDSGVLHMDGPRRTFVRGVCGHPRTACWALTGLLTAGAAVACCWGWDAGRPRTSAALRSGARAEVGPSRELYLRPWAKNVIANQTVHLAPRDVPLGMFCPNHSLVHFVPGLAGPWGLPIAMDGRGKDPGHKNLFSSEAEAERLAVRRVVVYFDLNWPQNTFCKMRALLNEERGHHVHVLTVGFPTKSKPRGLGDSTIWRCAPRWGRDYEWITNRPAVPDLSSLCDDHELPTPCELLMGLVQRLRPPEFPNIESVRVMGFSAAAQVLDKCMYSTGRSGRGLKQGGPDIRFLIVSPSTLLYPVPERAALPEPKALTCHSFDPATVLNHTSKFILPGRRVNDLASLTRAPEWYCHRERDDTATLDGQHDQCLRNRTDDGYRYKFTKGNDQLAPGCRGCWCCRQRKDLQAQQEHACKNYDHYRSGFKGRLPPDMPTGGTCSEHGCADNVRHAVRRSLLRHQTLYIAGSADVCNWRLQSRMSPQCGWCTADRTTYRTPTQKFGRDILSPLVSSCRAIWQGITRLDRMKIYKDLVDQVVAPRVGISREERLRKRKFYVLVGAGHADATVIQLLAGCLVRDECEGGNMVSMEDIAGNIAVLPSRAAGETANIWHG